MPFMCLEETDGLHCDSYDGVQMAEGLILPTALIKYNADLIINTGKTYNNELVIYDEVNIILEILWITHK